MLLPYFVSLRGSNLQNENNLNFEFFTGLTVTISIAIIMTPGIKTEICYYSGERPAETSINCNSSTGCCLSEEGSPHRK
jgi:hypothetical protein